MTKVCRDCKTEKPLTDFYKDKNRKDGFFCYCKGCSAVRRAKWARNNPHKRRANHLSYKYGMDEDGYNKLLQQQDGKCAICRTDKPGHKSKFVVDHNHQTGKVRGLLCAKCNAGLGHFQDSLSVMSAALSYLSLRGNYG